MDATGGPEQHWRLTWTSEQLQDTVKELALGVSAGAVTVEGVTTEWRTDLDEAPVLLVVLTLGQPPVGTETWPVDDMYEVREHIRRDAEAAHVPASLAFSMRGAGAEARDEPESALAERLGAGEQAR